MRGSLAGAQAELLHEEQRLGAARQRVAELHEELEESGTALAGFQAEFAELRQQMVHLEEHVVEQRDAVLARQRDELRRRNAALQVASCELEVELALREAEMERAARGAHSTGSASSTPELPAAAEKVVRRDFLAAQIPHVEQLQLRTRELSLALSVSMNSGDESPRPWLHEIVGLMEPLLKELSTLSVPPEHAASLGALRAELAGVLASACASGMRVGQYEGL